MMSVLTVDRLFFILTVFQETGTITRAYMYVCNLCSSCEIHIGAGMRTCLFRVGVCPRVALTCYKILSDADPAL